MRSLRTSQLNASRWADAVVNDNWLEPSRIPRRGPDGLRADRWCPSTELPLQQGPQPRRFPRGLSFDDRDPAGGKSW
jgi:hypothetical protein